MSTQFTTDVSVEVYDDNVLVNEESIQDVNIQWEFDLEMRAWGVKSTYVTVPDQRITLNYTVYDESGDNEIEQSKVIDLVNVQVNIENVNWSSSLLPRSLEFYQGKVIVNF